MGQYYKTYLEDVDGNEEAYCSQNAVYCTVHGYATADDIDDAKRTWDYDDPDSWGSLFSGLKLMEHSWMENDYVNGVVERIWDDPCRVAWVGDYADAAVDGFPESVYRKVWPRDDDDGLPELAFAERPKVHRTGYLVNHTKGVYLDLERYGNEAGYLPEWQREGDAWTIHPLPLLTAIGNGRGGGDYRDCYPNYDMVGSWAMDEIEYTEADPNAKVDGETYVEVDYDRHVFKEVEVPDASRDPNFTYINCNGIPKEWVPEVTDDDLATYLRVRSAFAAEELRERLNDDYIADGGWRVKMTRDSFDMVADWLEDDIVCNGDGCTGDNLHDRLLECGYIEQR